MRKPWVGVLVAALSLGLASVSTADEIDSGEIIVPDEVPPPPAPPPPMEEEDDRTGPYLGIGGTYLINEGFDRLPAPNGKGDFHNSWGFNLRGGYRFLPFLAAEAVLEYGDDFSAGAAFPDANFPTRTATLSETLWTINFSVNAKAILPLGPVEPYLAGGVGFLYANRLRIAETWQIPDEPGATEPILTKSSASDDPIVFAGRVAGGIDYAITDTVGIFAEASYSLPTGELSDLNVIAINFGGRLTF